MKGGALDGARRVTASSDLDFGETAAVTEEGEHVHPESFHTVGLETQVERRALL
jgi:hypothetical protein